MSNNVINRNEVLNLLHAGPLYIKFTKSDGTVREMIGSLAEHLVKPYERKTERVKSVNNNTQSIFDIDKQEWRSFRWDNIISYENP